MTEVNIKQKEPLKKARTPKTAVQDLSLIHI